MGHNFLSGLLADALRNSYSYEIYAAKVECRKLGFLKILARDESDKPKHISWIVVIGDPYMSGRAILWFRIHSVYYTGV